MSAFDFAPIMANQKILEMQAAKEEELKNRQMQESPWFNIVKEAFPLNASENESPMLGQSIGAPAQPPLPFTGNREPAAMGAMQEMPANIESYRTTSPQVIPGVGGMIDQLTKKQLESQRLQQEGINALQKRMEELQKTPTQQGGLGRAIALAADMWGGGGGMYSKAFEQANPQMTEAQKQEAILKMEDMLRRSRGELTQSDIDILKAQIGYKTDLAKLNTKAPPDIKQWEYQAGEYASRLNASNQGLDQLLQRYDPTTLGASVWKPEFLKEDDRKSYEQYKRQFINAALRRESGATISPKEMEEANLQYFPVAGDTSGILQQKKLAREQAFQNMAATAGPAMAKMNIGNLSAPRKSVSTGEIINGYRFKGGNPNDKNNWEKM